MFLLIKKSFHFFSYDTRRAITPYIYMAPTIALLASLMLLPMIVVFRYSLFDNVIMNKNPTFVGLNNYEKFITEWIIEGHKNDWKPNVYGQVKSWIDNGLKARAVTRDLD